MKIELRGELQLFDRTTGKLLFKLAGKANGKDIGGTITLELPPEAYRNQVILRPVKITIDDSEE